MAQEHLVDLLSLWVKVPEENEDEYSYWIGPDRPSKNAILITKDNAEAWLDENDERGARLTITLHDDIEQARAEAIRVETSPHVRTEIGRLASGRGATLIQHLDESYDGYIRMEMDGESLSPHDPARISYELSDDQIKSYSSEPIIEHFRERKLDNLMVAITEAARNDPSLLERLQDRLAGTLGNGFPKP